MGIMEPECIIHLTDSKLGSLVKATYSRRTFWQIERLPKPKKLEGKVAWELATIKLEMDFLKLVTEVRKERKDFNFYPFDKERAMAVEVVKKGKNIKVIKEMPYRLLRMVS